MFGRLGGGGFYGRETFNPGLIITQVVVLQTSFYVMASVVTCSAFAFFRIPMSAARLFSAETYSFSAQYGPLFDVVYFACCLAMAPIVNTVVERARKCLDFVVSYHFFHFVAAWASHGFPSTVGFWVTNGTAVMCTTLLSEWLCFQSEMQEIQMGHRTAQAVETELADESGTSSEPTTVVVGKPAASRED